MVLVFVAALLVFQLGGFVNSFERGLHSFGGYGPFVNSAIPFTSCRCVCRGVGSSGAGAHFRTLSVMRAAGDDEPLVPVAFALTRVPAGSSIGSCGTRASGHS